MSRTMFAPTTPKGDTLLNHYGDKTLNSHYGPKPKLVIQKTEVTDINGMPV